MNRSMLTGENYTVWAIKAEANLDAAELWEAVVPAEDSAAAIVAKKDKPARAYLLGDLSEEILLQVSTKKTTIELWASLRTRFVGADRVHAARLATFRGEFERLRMAEAETLDAFAGAIGGMTGRYAGLVLTLDDAAMVKKLPDSVPDHLCATVAGIEQFCDVGTMVFEEELGRLKTFEERTRRCAQTSAERADEQVMLTTTQWVERPHQQGGAFHDDDDGGNTASACGGKR
ncbi:retrotransposon protein [Hordeum vulgare]|nr:retrotransposon protein [Hordeum vulgare]